MRTTTTLTAPVEKTDGEEITELEKFEPTRVDGVGTPANGFPILMMKGIGQGAPPAAPKAAKKTPKARPDGVLSKGQHAAALDIVKGLLAGSLAAVRLSKDGGYDESADIAGALATIKQIAALIVSEATELGKGRLEEVCDIETLVSAIYAMKCFLRAEQAQDGGGPADGGMAADDDLGGSVSYLAQSAKATKRVAEYEDLVKAKYTAEQKRDLMQQGKAIPNEKGEPSYPIDDAEDLTRAIHAVGRGKTAHGKIRAHIKRQAKRLGLAAKIPDGWKSGAPATKGAMLTMSKAQQPAITPDVIKAAVAEAVAASEDRLKAVEAELVKVRSMPIPGGPQLVTSHSPRPTDPNPVTAEATRLRAIAAKASDPDVRRAYLELAAQKEGTTPKG